MNLHRESRFLTFAGCATAGVQKVDQTAARQRHWIWRGTLLFSSRFIFFQKTVDCRVPDIELFRAIYLFAKWPINRLSGS
jgi:hypothetical protein